MRMNESVPSEAMAGRDGRLGKKVQKSEEFPDKVEMGVLGSIIHLEIEYELIH